MTKIIVLDDDPTGSQTVHSCLLLMQWDVDTLVEGLEDESPIFFVLTNSRSLTSDRAEIVYREVCRNLKTAIDRTDTRDYILVSRSDSTLRGHYPLETDIMADEFGNFDAHFLLPAFFEGGRVTRDSIHYLIVDGVPTPVSETEFAKDSVFAYHHSYLPDYVAEKTTGKIAAADVERFLLADIRGGCLSRLLTLTGNTCCVVDGETQADFDRFAADLLTATAEGKRFLLRSAASILTSLAAVGKQPLPAEEMNKYVRGSRSGVAIVGSHVGKTTAQLKQLLAEEGVVGIEIPVAELQSDDVVAASAILRRDVARRIAAAKDGGLFPVVYTSREELVFENIDLRIAFGDLVSDLLMDIVRDLPANTGFLIGKGGITSNNILSVGLQLRSARLLGQIIPGCSLVTTPENHPNLPSLPVVLFPGNVGDNGALALVYRRLVGK
jgi:uncharacterized protein YgbK (DUF1537 family)